ncbi:MAG TPA: patatin-like phospholipase family protein, partial [Steroidobacteraceae bacterium]|nr:patatin-like phospholipase family protein [Steroidobacteraceae bacterium]
AGGGPLGAFYELGVLHALGEAIEGRDLTDFDVYVGVSSGALVASGLANGFDTTEMGAIFIEDESTRYPFRPGMLLRPAVGEYLRRARQVPGVVTGMVAEYAREPLQNLWPASVGSLEKLVPTALFDNAPLESYLHKAFSTNGHTDDFRKLRHHLYVVATNLNTGESVRFGEPGNDRVPVSRAVCASTALPGLYSAVEIDGQFFVDGALIRTMNASLALEEGCGLVICINPLVPFDASRAPTRRNANLADEGLPTVLAQTFRALIHSRMQVGMASYRARFPQATTLLMEPDRNDEQLFFANVFRYAGRRRLVDHAYQCARRDLRAQADVLGPLLRRHGLELNTAVLDERNRSFSSAGRQRRERTRSTAQRLAKALGRLETELAKSSARA